MNVERGLTIEIRHNSHHRRVLGSELSDANTLQMRGIRRVGLGGGIGCAFQVNDQSWGVLELKNRIGCLAGRGDIHKGLARRAGSDLYARNLKGS